MQVTREFLFHFVKILAHEFPFWIRDVWIFYNSFVKRSQDFPKWVIAVGKLKKYNFNILSEGRVIMILKFIWRPLLPLKKIISLPIFLYELQTFLFNALLSVT